MKLTKREIAKVKAAYRALFAVSDAGIIERINKELEEKYGEGCERSYLYAALEELASLLDSPKDAE